MPRPVVPICASPHARSRAPGRARRDTARISGQCSLIVSRDVTSTPAASQLVDLLQQRGRRQHDAIADVARTLGRRMPDGIEAQDRLLAVDDERVAGIVTALKAHDAVRVVCQPVDDLAFAFIAPLRADDDYVLAMCSSLLGAIDLPRLSRATDRAIKLHSLASARSLSLPAAAPRLRRPRAIVRSARASA